MALRTMQVCAVLRCRRGLHGSSEVLKGSRDANIKANAERRAPGRVRGVFFQRLHQRSYVVDAALYAANLRHRRAAGKHRDAGHHFAYCGGAIVALALLEIARDLILLRASVWLDHELGRHILQNRLKLGAAQDIRDDARAQSSFMDFSRAPPRVCFSMCLLYRCFWRRCLRSIR